MSEKNSDVPSQLVPIEPQDEHYLLYRGDHCFGYELLRSADNPDTLKTLAENRGMLGCTIVHARLNVGVTLDDVATEFLSYKLYTKVRYWFIRSAWTTNGVNTYNWVELKGDE